MAKTAPTAEEMLEELVSTLDGLPYRPLRKFSELFAMQAESRDCTDAKQVTEILADVCESFFESEE